MRKFGKAATERGTPGANIHLGMMGDTSGIT